MVAIHKVNLTEEDRNKLHDLLKVGEHPARTIAWGYVLLLASQGKHDEEIAQTLEVGRATVQRIRKRYCQKGLDHALNELPRPGAAPRLNGKLEAYVVALACSDPPEGRTCWTLQLLANQLVQLHMVEEISYETVHRVLKRGLNGNLHWSKRASISVRWAAGFFRKRHCCRRVSSRCCNCRRRTCQR